MLFSLLFYGVDPEGGHQVTAVTYEGSVSPEIRERLERLIAVAFSVSSHSGPNFDSHSH